MIYFLSKRAHEYTWRRSLENSYGRDDPAIRRELFERVTLVSYEKLFTLRELPVGSYVFADLDRLTVTETEHAALFWQALSAVGPPVRLFNHPIRSMRRYELLRHLYEEGINRFNVQRLTEPFRLEHFPVFIRSESSHFVEDITPLLDCREDVERAVAEIVAAGRSRDDKIIVEYVDARDEAGVSHQFSALMADGQVIRHYCAQSSHWVVKEMPTAPERRADAERRAGKHAPELLRIMSHAKIDFGRIDYAVIDSEIQTFEINTNPTIGPAETLLQVARILDTAPSAAAIPVTWRYRPRRDEPRARGRWFRLQRYLHLMLRQAGLLSWEPAVMRAGAPVKRAVKKLRRRPGNRTA